MFTFLVFRTFTSVSVPPGQTVQLCYADVRNFAKIRVVAVERAGSATGVNILLINNRRSCSSWAA
jgi:hypothetical protein